MKTDKKVFALAAVLFTLALLSLWGVRLWTFGVFPHERVEMHGGVAWRVGRDYERHWKEANPVSAPISALLPLTISDYVRPDIRRARTTYIRLPDTRPGLTVFLEVRGKVWQSEKEKEELESHLAYAAHRP